MSTSDKERPTGRLRAFAGEGTRIEVLDGNFRQVHLSDTRLDEELPRGLYTVRFSLGGVGEEQLVRVRPGTVTNAGPQDSLLSGEPETILSLRADRGPLWFQRIEMLLAHGRETAEQGAIVVLAQSLEGQVSSDVARSVSLSRGETSEPEALEPSQRLASVKQGWSARRYDCGAGVFALHFETYERKRMMQTLYAVPGRTTIVLLDYGQGRIVSQLQGKSALTRRRGIDPARSLVFSLPAANPAQRARPAERMARLLTYTLSCAPSPADTARLAKLQHQLREDPLLRLLAACCILQIAELHHDREAAVLATRFLETVDLPGPDMKCIRWKLADFFVVGRGIPEEPLRFPPLLDACWRWAAELSASNPDIVSNVGPTIRASGAVSLFRPWLVVASAVQTARTTQEDPLDDPLRAAEINFDRLLQAMNGLRQEERRPGDAERTLRAVPAGPFLKTLGVSDSSIRLAGSAARIVAGEESTRTIVARMARATGMPVRRLNAELRKAADELGSDEALRALSEGWPRAGKETGEG